MQTLDLYPNMAAWAYERSDTNIISFSSKKQKKISKGSETAKELSDPCPKAEKWDYFMIQATPYVDENDPDTLLNYFELDDQSNGNYYDVTAVFYPQRVEIGFGQALFMSKYSTVAIHFTRSSVPLDVVRFFANGLYLGDCMTYNDNFPEEYRVEQTEFRYSLEDIEEEMDKVSEEALDKELEIELERIRKEIEDRQKLIYGVTSKELESK
jgi:hypothetical protein